MKNVIRGPTRWLVAALLGSMIGCAAPTSTTAQDRLDGTLVVVNKGEATASVIDVRTGETVTKLPTGPGPHELAMSSDGRWAVVTDYGGNTLTVIDVARVTVDRTIDLGQYNRPHGIAYLPGDSLVAVTSEATQTVVIVRVADGETVGTVTTGQGGSHMLAVVGSGRTIYTGNIQPGTVSELDVARGERTRNFTVPDQPEAITVSGDGREVWVGSNSEGKVSVLDPTTGSVRTVLEGFEWPYRILLTPNGRLVIIPDMGRNEVRIVDRSTGQERHIIDMPGAGPQGVTLAGDPQYLFLSLSRQDRVAVIDLESGEIVRYISTGEGPDGIGWSPVSVRASG